MGKFSRRTSVKIQPSGHSHILVGGWWFIFGNLSSWIRDAYCLEIHRGEEIWERLCEQQIPELGAIWKGKKHPRSNYDLKAEMCLAQGPTYKCLITYRCFSRQGNVQMVIVSCHSVCPVWQAKSQLDFRCSLSAPLLRQCRSRPLDGSVTFGLKWQKSQRQFICAQIYKK